MPKMSILVNWNQGNSDMIHAHQIMNVQPGTCQIGDMKDKCDVFGSVQEAEAAIRQRGIKKLGYALYQGYPYMLWSFGLRPLTC